MSRVRLNWILVTHVPLLLDQSDEPRRNRRSARHERFPHALMPDINCVPKRPWNPAQLARASQQKKII